MINKQSSLVNWIKEKAWEINVFMILLGFNFNKREVLNLKFVLMKMTLMLQKTREKTRVNKWKCYDGIYSLEMDDG